MVTAGLVGGLGPESTIDYYRRILEAWRQHDPSSSPSLVIDSLDVQRGLQLVASDRAAFTDYLLESIRRLAAAGVDFIAITANTPHLVFDELAAHSSVPLISIVEVSARAARQRALQPPAAARDAIHHGGDVLSRRVCQVRAGCDRARRSGPDVDP